MRKGDNLFTISAVALDARTGALKWSYQLRANDAHDWDATNVSLFDSAGRKLLATSGKEGILHVVHRASGKRVFELPVTTVLNHDAVLTPAGVRVCPVAGVQWNGAAFTHGPDCSTSTPIDWCSTFKLGPEPNGRPRYLIPALRTAGAPTTRRTSETVGSMRSTRRRARWRGV